MGTPINATAPQIRLRRRRALRTLADMSDENNSNPPAPPADTDAFLILAGPGTAQTKVEGSQFLATARPVDSEDQAQAIVEEARKEHYDARHICYGLRVGLGAARIDRSNDDGEPPRTGGYPLWQLLSGESIENALIYVVRYFGGTKLGMGGLTRAYRDAGRAALDDAGTTLFHPTTDLALTLDYERFGAFEYLVDQTEGLAIEDREFTDQVTLQLTLWTSRAEPIRRRIAEFLGRHADDL